MSKIKALIIEDDVSAQSILQKYLQLSACVEISDTLENTGLALERIKTLMPDVIFLDINMPDENGLDFAKRLRDNDIETQVVFTTAYKQYAYNALNVNPIEYLVKPFGLDDVFNVISKVEENIKKQEERVKNKSIWGNRIPNKLKFKTPEGCCFINPRDIFYANADRGVTTLYLCSGENIIVSVALKNIVSMLESYDFIKVNRSSLVNMKLIDSIDRKSQLCVLRFGDRVEEFLMKREVLKELNDIDAIVLG